LGINGQALKTSRVHSILAHDFKQGYRMDKFLNDDYNLLPLFVG
jgi:hypothetical protein